jgi:hypothetical protein
VKSTSAAFFISARAAARHGKQAPRRERETSIRIANVGNFDEPRQQPRRRPGMIFDNQIVDDARGRAMTIFGLRPRFCSRSRSGDGACLKRRRCWFDSRREHRGESVFAYPSALRGPTGDGYQARNLTPRPSCARLRLRPFVRSRTDRRRSSLTTIGRAWAAIWDRAGLQNRPARFNPSAARPRKHPVVVQGGLGPTGPHKPGIRSVRFRPLQLESRPHAAISGSQ